MKAFRSHLVNEVGDLRRPRNWHPRGRGGSCLATGAMAISVKIEDGNLDILYAAVTEMLELLGV